MTWWLLPIVHIIYMHACIVHVYGYQFTLCPEDRVTNEIVTCLYISIGDTSLPILSTVPEPISDKTRIYVLLPLLSFI